MLSDSPSLLWFRQDLRLADNPALHAALARGAPIVPVFIWAPEEEAPWVPGAASRVWLHRSLQSLDASLRCVGSRLIVRKAASLEALRTLVRESGAGAVYWNCRHEPVCVARDAEVERALRTDGIACCTRNGALLVEPVSLLNKAGEPFKVFTPFWRAAARDIPVAEPLPAPRRIPAPGQWPDSLPLAALGLEPAIDWAGGIREAWQPGEAGAREMLGQFADGVVDAYPAARDLPGEAGTSRLSPHLHFGEIGARSVYHALSARAAGVPGAAAGAEAAIRQLCWREFSYYLLHHFPHTAEHPLHRQFERFPWRDDAKELRAWQRGQTGYPLVDAGMRELWHTGWMHNRVRMVVASFLVKHLLHDWRHGARWFWDTLVDADLANNTMGWQWTAGCGADAAPYFRVFNPVAQGEKFDPGGAYVRQWVPEIAGLPDAYIHKPWEASAIELSAAGITLGATYPHPIVAHAAARQRALEAYAICRS